MKTIIKLTAVLLIISFSACTGQSKKETKERVITVTIEPQRYFTEAIAGDRFTVVSMVPKGSSPETYDPTPKQLVSLGESEAYFRIGHIGFEVAWMERLMKNAPHTQVFDLSKGIEFIHGPGHAHGDHYHVGGVDPHTWNSAINAKIMANNIFQALCTLDKENEAHYLARYDSLVHRIERTDSVVFHMLKENDEADHAFMIYHPALSYFARDYGLHQICIEEGGKEPSPAHLKELIEISKFEDVRVIFVQPEFDQRNAEIIAKETGTKIVSINPLSYDWEEEMIHIAKSLVP
ncbi:metal ABC transporter solute-binding protein, Zn/Mn family [Bacteroides sp. 51]|uniref:metal ABC transporter solute-binding protein, Zn/Mn family n=1 Tax=Bacteroides sp. 51 TaxID=2302938 RepID=UPI0013D69D24|nr:zinc ABC transporter substrate-binding protein [Bacteroides sp. 51]NDV80662.1 zinc ABC transporter substrate-binding protein [Bacteroides sp. 51]